MIGILIATNIFCLCTVEACSSSFRGPSAKPAIQEEAEVRAETEAKQLAASAQNLRKIMTATLTWHQHNGHYPPSSGAWEFDDATRTWSKRKGNLSWRVALLPLLGENDLYTEFNLDEDWDSPHNLKLVERIPQVFICPGGSAKIGETHYLGVRGDGVSFSESDTVAARDFTDGTVQTVFLIEVSDKNAVVWTKPDDFDLPTDITELDLSKLGLRESGILVSTADGSVHLLSRGIPADILRGVLLRNDGSYVNFEQAKWRRSINRLSD